jgi:hypothetical protein
MSNSRKELRVALANVVGDQARQRVALRMMALREAGADRGDRIVTADTE